MEHVVNSYVVSDGVQYPLLNHGDVVLVHEFGYGLIKEDEDKYVQILGYKDAGYYDGPGYLIKPYDCELKTQNPGKNGHIGVESFGTNPMVLLNVHDDVNTPTHIKIEVLTAEFNYQGLYKGTVIDNAKITPDGDALFKYNGKSWVLDECRYLVFKDNHVTSVEIKPIKSDGGSSSYYDFKIPEHYLELIKETGVIKTEYLIDILFKNDFDFACTFKALVRAKGITEGAGKEGNTLDYELNKMDYYEARIKEKYNWRENE